MINFHQAQRRPKSAAAPCIALIGCGAIAECYHLPALIKQHPVAEKLILVDKDAARVQRLATEFGIQQTACNYQTITDRVDGVIVATPHHLHSPIAMHFLSRGVHVLCEKPLAESVAEAAALVAQAEKAGVTLAVNHTRRLFPAYGAIKDLLAQGAIGPLRAIRYIDGEPFTWPTASGFYFQKRSPTGVLLDRGIHSMDLICWWLGEKPALVSSQNDAFGGMEGVAKVILRHGSCNVLLHLSWLTRLANTYTIVGDLGTITGGIEAWDRVTIHYHSGKTRTIRLPVKERAFNDFGQKMIANFLALCTPGTTKDCAIKPLVPASDVLPALELIEECYQKAGRFPMPWLYPEAIEGGKIDRREMHGVEMATEFPKAMATELSNGR